MMCELPSNALIAGQFLEHVDGFSIGSNDMTQLVLGLDRDSSLVAGSFDERNPAVLAVLEMAIRACRERGKYVGICGQGPSDHPDLAEWLVEQGIESMSLNPDTVVDTWLRLAKATTTRSSDAGSTVSESVAARGAREEGDGTRRLLPGSPVVRARMVGGRHGHGTRHHDRRCGVCR
jgi:phosphoenolpyruvate-protein kinase (PTS system EI component)